MHGIKLKAAKWTKTGARLTYQGRDGRLRALVIGRAGLLTVPEAARLLGVTKAAIYNWTGSGYAKSKREGRRTMLPMSSARALRAQLRHEGREVPSKWTAA